MSEQKIVAQKIVLTGDRPTGPLHLGHYIGSLQNRLSMQQEYKQYIIIADLQALTHNFDQSNKLIANIYQVLSDYLAIGLDPNLNTFCIQSALPGLSEISFYYMNLVNLSRLQRNPTIKQEIIDKGYEESLPIGFLCHPISQAADITAFGADLVPVGEDQKPLIEQSNEIVRKFNSLYPGNILKEVEAMLSKTPRLLGVDGKAKASKSLNNAIFLNDSYEVVKEKVYSMYTDPNHIKISDPGKVEGNIVFHYLDAFYGDTQHLLQLKNDYSKGGLGDMELKKFLLKILEEILEPIRIKRQNIAQDDMDSIINMGNIASNITVNQTLKKIREAIGLFVPNSFTRSV